MKILYNLLFVDDDVYSLDGIRASLDLSGMKIKETFWVTSIKAAKEVMGQYPIDVLICDIEMPGGSGIDLLEWIAQKRISVVTMLLTCFSSFEYAHQAIHYHVFDYILKPVRSEELAQKIGKALEQREKEVLVKETLEPNAESWGEDSAVSRMKEYIEQNLNSELTRKEISSQVFLNPDYAARIFKNEEGITLKDYIRNRRISRVKKLLLSTSKSVDVICSEAGFSYNSYFYNTFREMEGMTPQEYRNKFRKLQNRSGD